MVQSLIVVILFSGTISVSAQDSDESQPAENAAVDSVGDEMLLDAEVGDTSALQFGLERDHYDNDGYPESENGMLVLQKDPDGPMLYMKSDSQPYLLYAQYVNRQRDAVYLARSGSVTDVLPNGASREIPYGYGAVKLNAVYVSIVESLLKPHFSDNQKVYVDFPLSDFYFGGEFGLTGIFAKARYVHKESITASLHVGINTFGSMSAESVLNQYLVPIRVGGGYRFPGMFSELIGSTLWTAGGELFLGLGDRDNDESTPAAVFMPGIYLEVERVLVDEADQLQRNLAVNDTDYREDPRPFNYHVSSLSLKLGAYFDFQAINRSRGFILPSVSLSYQINAIGPKIPPHEFKETEVLYLNELYRDDLIRQKERRDARNRR